MNPQQQKQQMLNRLAKIMTQRSQAAADGVDAAAPGVCVCCVFTFLQHIYRALRL